MNIQSQSINNLQFQTTYQSSYNVQGNQLMIAPRCQILTLSTGVKIYFQEAGDPSNPTLLLLHGFPTSSSYFRNMIPVLASSYGFHVVAPDLPGFGASEAPDNFDFTFKKLAQTLTLFLDAIDVRNFGLYCMGEYGLMVAWKLIPYKLEFLTGLVIQNGTIYDEGRPNIDLLDVFKTVNFLPTPCQSLNSSGLKSPKPTIIFGARKEYLSENKKHPSVSFSESIDIIRPNELPERELLSQCSFENESGYQQQHFLDRGITSSPVEFQNSSITLNQVKNLYETSNTSRHIFKECSSIDPHAYLIDYTLLSRPNQSSIQKQLFADYIHEYETGIYKSAPLWLRTTNLPVLIIWGDNDPILDSSVSINNFKRDCRHRQIKIFEDGGHFVVEQYPVEIATLVSEFFNEKGVNIWSNSTY